MLFFLLLPSGEQELLHENSFLHPAFRLHLDFLSVLKNPTTLGVSLRSWFTNVCPVVQIARDFPGTPLLLISLPGGLCLPSLYLSAGVGVWALFNAPRAVLTHALSCIPQKQPQ